MLLETKQPLPLKSRILFSNVNALGANVDLAVAQGANRHSIVVHCVGQHYVFFNGLQTTVCDSNLVFPGQTVYSWDDYGDAINIINNIRLVAPATNILIIETYTEERPDNQ